MKVYASLFLIVFILSCNFLKREKKHVVHQGENGNFELMATTSHDTLVSNQLEDLRFYFTLKNKYPFPVQSLKYLSFLECDVQRDGKYFHTVGCAFKPVKKLTPKWNEVFPADTSITIIVFVDIDQICNEKGYRGRTGNYTIQGFYISDLIAEDNNIPSWIGALKSNQCNVLITKSY